MTESHVTSPPPPPEVFAYTAIFALLLLANLTWALVNLVIIYVKQNVIPSPKYHAALNILVIVACVFRGGALTFVFVPFGGEPWELAVVWTITSMPVPALFSAFYLVFAALKNMTRMRLVSKRLFGTCFLICFVTANFSASVLANCLTAFVMPEGIAVIVCEVYYLVIGIVGFCGFMWDYNTLYQSTVVNRRYLQAQSGMTGGKGIKKPKRGRAQQASTAWLSRDLTWISQNCHSWTSDDEETVFDNAVVAEVTTISPPTQAPPGDPVSNHTVCVHQRPEGRTEESSSTGPSIKQAPQGAPPHNHEAPQGVFDKSRFTSMPRAVRVTLNIAILILLFTLFGCYGLVATCVYMDNVRLLEHPVANWIHRVLQCVLETALAVAILWVTSITINRKKK